MTPQEKANELVNQYRIILMSKDTDCGNEIFCTLIAKECALIAVDEVLYALSVPPINNKGHLLYDGQIDYWKNIKQEIEKL